MRGKESVHDHKLSFTIVMNRGKLYVYIRVDHDAANYRIAGIIDKAFNLIIQQNLGDSSVSLIIMDNRLYKSFCQIKNSSSTVFHQFVKFKRRQ